MFTLCFFQLHDYTVNLKCDCFEGATESSRYILILFLLLGQREYGKNVLLNLHFLMYHKKKNTNIWKNLKASSLLNEEAGEIYLSTFARITNSNPNKSNFEHMRRYLHMLPFVWKATKDLEDDTHFEFTAGIDPEEGKCDQGHVQKKHYRIKPDDVKVELVSASLNTFIEECETVIRTGTPFMQEEQSPAEGKERKQAEEKKQQARPAHLRPKLETGIFYVQSIILPRLQREQTFLRENLSTFWGEDPMVEVWPMSDRDKRRFGPEQEEVQEELLEIQQRLDQNDAKVEHLYAYNVLPSRSGVIWILTIHACISNRSKQGWQKMFSLQHDKCLTVEQDSTHTYEHGAIWKSVA